MFTINASKNLFRCSSKLKQRPKPTLHRLNKHIKEQTIFFGSVDYYTQLQKQVLRLLPSISLGNQKRIFCTETPNSPMKGSSTNTGCVFNSPIENNPTNITPSSIETKKKEPTLLQAYASLAKVWIL